jgi:hypothetical protein
MGKRSVSWDAIFIWNRTTILVVLLDLDDGTPLQIIQVPLSKKIVGRSISCCCFFFGVAIESLVTFSNKWAKLVDFTLEKWKFPIFFKKWLDLYPKKNIELNSTIKMTHAKHTMENCEFQSIGWITNYFFGGVELKWTSISFSLEAMICISFKH